MAKKVVATLKSGKGKDFTKVIKMIKSDKTGAYNFKEEIVHIDHVADFLKSKCSVDRSLQERPTAQRHRCKPR